MSVIALFRSGLSLSNDKFIYQIKFQRDNNSKVFFSFSLVCVCFFVWSLLNTDTHACTNIASNMHGHTLLFNNSSKSQLDYDGPHCSAGNISIYTVIVIWYWIESEQWIWCTQKEAEVAYVYLCVTKQSVSGFPIQNKTKKKSNIHNNLCISINKRNVQCEWSAVRSSMACCCCSAVCAYG